MKNDSRLRKYVPSLLLFLLFKAVAVTLWFTKDNLFYPKIASASWTPAQ